MAEYCGDTAFRLRTDDAHHVAALIHQRSALIARPHRHVSRLERFDANLTLGTLGKVARALGANLQIDLVPEAA